MRGGIAIAGGRCLMRPAIPYPLSDEHPSLPLFHHLRLLGRPAEAEGELRDGLG